MAAEITLFTDTGIVGGKEAQIARSPVAPYTGTFTPTVSGVMRVYANAAPVILTVNSVTWTVPSGNVEYFAVNANQQVAVA